MTVLSRLVATTALAAFALGAAACTQQEAAPAAEQAAAPAAAPETRTVVETREVAVPVPVAPPTVVVERPEVRAGDSTTVRAGRDGIEVETTNR
jgi:ABC-type Fe3+-hydroxamate transport system substrate-binding protein